MKIGQRHWRIAAFSIAAAWITTMLVSAAAHRAWVSVAILGVWGALIAIGPLLRKHLYAGTGSVAAPARRGPRRNRGDSGASRGSTVNAPGTLRLSRRTGILARWRPITVRISDEISVDLDRNETLEVPLDAGTYRLSASVRTCTSNDLEASIQAGSTVEVIVGFAGHQPAARRTEVIVLAMGDESP